MSPEAEIIVDRLAALPLISSVPRDELEWLASRGEMRSLETGIVVNETSAPIDEMFILLAGRVGLYLEQGGGSRKLLEAVPGARPDSVFRFQRSPGTVVVDEDATAFVLHQRHFPVLMRECLGLTTALVHPCWIARAPTGRCN